MREIKKRLGEMLIEAGLIDGLQLSSALGQQRQWGGRLASILIDMGFIDERSIASVLEKKLGQKCISLKNRKIPAEALKIVNHDIATKYGILPLDFDKKSLTIAMSDPTDLKTIDELSFVFGLKIKPLLAIESNINKAIALHYTGITPKVIKHTIDTNKLPEDLQVTRFERTKPDTSHPPEIVIETLVEVLIEKGLITKEEITNKIWGKLRESQP